LDTVTILNDCAYVGYEIAEELRIRGYDVLYFPRKRGLYSKTMGTLLNVLRSKGILHVNYALQDAYLAGKLRGGFLLHAHGSDLRWSIAGRWGWVVRSSLKVASKVIVATPDLLETAREYRADAQYLPNPVDTERFAPLPSEKGSTKTALYFPKWYETLPDELVKELRKAGFVLSTPTAPVKYEDMPQYLSAHEVFIDRFTIRALSKTCLEAMSCGIPSIDYRHRGYLAERVKSLAVSDVYCNESKLARAHVLQNHDRRKVVDTLIRIYAEIS
jgi:glycosyltransferase involved in cell wall biosynthesis